MITVRDIMTKRVIAASPGDSLIKTTWKLGLEDISGLPVRNAKGTVLGVISKTDLLSFLADGRGDCPVGLTMSDEIFSLSSCEPALKAVEMMLEKKVHRVIVIDDDELVGIVTTTDILKAVVENACFQERQVENTGYRRAHL